MADVERMLQDIDEAAGVDPRRGGLKLSAWEEEFIESIKEQFEDRGTLTDKQKAKLSEIWERI